MGWGLSVNLWCVQSRHRIARPLQAPLTVANPFFLCSFVRMGTLRSTEFPPGNTTFSLPNSLRGVPLTAWARRAPVASPPHRCKPFPSLFICSNGDFHGSTEFPPGNTTTTCRIPSGGNSSLPGRDARPLQAPLAVANPFFLCSFVRMGTLRSTEFPPGNPTTPCRTPSGGYHSLPGRGHTYRGAGATLIGESAPPL